MLFIYTYKFIQSTTGPTGGWKVVSETGKFTDRKAKGGIFPAQLPVPEAVAFFRGDEPPRKRRPPGPNGELQDYFEALAEQQDEGASFFGVPNGQGKGVMEVNFTRASAIRQNGSVELGEGDVFDEARAAHIRLLAFRMDLEVAMKDEREEGYFVVCRGGGFCEGIYKSAKSAIRAILLGADRSTTPLTLHYRTKEDAREGFWARDPEGYKAWLDRTEPESDAESEGMENSESSESASLGAIPVQGSGGVKIAAKKTSRVKLMTGAQRSGMGKVSSEPQSSTSSSSSILASSTSYSALASLSSSMVDGDCRASGPSRKKQRKGEMMARGP